MPAVHTDRVTDVETARVGAPSAVGRRALAMIAGAVLVGATLRLPRGSVRVLRRPATHCAAVWIVATVIGDPAAIARRPTVPGSRDVGIGAVVGAVMFGVFVVGAAIGRHLSFLAGPIDSILRKADTGPVVAVLALALVNGVAEELFFRGCPVRRAPRFRQACRRALDRLLRRRHGRGRQHRAHGCGCGDGGGVRCGTVVDPSTAASHRDAPGVVDADDPGVPTVICSRPRRSRDRAASAFAVDDAVGDAEDHHGDDAVEPPVVGRRDDRDDREHGCSSDPPAPPAAADPHRGAPTSTAQPTCSEGIAATWLEIPLPPEPYTERWYFKPASMNPRSGRKRGGATGMVWIAMQPAISSAQRAAHGRVAVAVADEQPDQQDPGRWDVGAAVVDVEELHDRLVVDQQVLQPQLAREVDVLLEPVQRASVLDRPFGLGDGELRARTARWRRARTPGRPRGTCVRTACTQRDPDRRRRDDDDGEHDRDLDRDLPRQPHDGCRGPGLEHDDGGADLGERPHEGRRRGSPGAGNHRTAGCRARPRSGTASRRRRGSGCRGSRCCRCWSSGSGPSAAGSPCRSTRSTARTCCTPCACRAARCCTCCRSRATSG